MMTKNPLQIGHFITSKIIKQKAYMQKPIFKVPTLQKREWKSPQCVEKYNKDSSTDAESSTVLQRIWRTKLVVHHSASLYLDAFWLRHVDNLEPFRVPRTVIQPPVKYGWEVLIILWWTSTSIMYRSWVDVLPLINHKPTIGGCAPSQQPCTDYLWVCSLSKPGTDHRRQCSLSSTMYRPLVGVNTKNNTKIHC